MSTRLLLLAFLIFAPPNQVENPDNVLNANRQRYPNQEIHLPKGFPENVQCSALLVFENYCKRKGKKISKYILELPVINPNAYYPNAAFTYHRGGNGSTANDHVKIKVKRIYQETSTFTKNNNR